MASKTKTSKVSPILVIAGEDPFLIGNECRRVLDTLLTAEEFEMGLSEPRADTAEIADVLDELRTLPFLASKRVVLIKDAEPFVKGNADKLDAYLENPSPTGTLVLTVTSWDKRTRLHKHLQKSGGLIELDKMKSHQMPAYAAGYAQQTYSIRLDTQCSRILVELVGDDPGLLCREVDKLAVYVAPKKTVTPQDIEQLTGKNRMFGAFEVIDSVNARQIAPALSRLRNMFEADKDAEYTVVGAFSWHFRRLFRAKAFMDKGLTPQQAAKNAGVFGYFQKDFIRQAGQMTLPQLGRILAELGRIDFGIKTGKTSAPVAMERLIFRILAMQK